jgi:hypothetical protein
MKILRISLLSFVCAALVVMASSFSAKRFTTINYSFNQTFANLTSNSDPLDDTPNWDVVTSHGCTNPNNLICAAEVTNLPGETMPSEAVVIAQIRAQYDANGKTLADNEVVEIFVSTVKVAEAIIKLKS